MADERERQIRKRLEAATSGPWYRGSKDERVPGRLTVWCGAETLVQIAATGASLDAELIAGAPADLAYLLDALAAARERERGLRDEVAKIFFWNETRQVVEEHYYEGSSDLNPDAWPAITRVVRAALAEEGEDG